MNEKVLVISKAQEDPSSYYRLIQYLDGYSNVKIVNEFSVRQYRCYYSPKNSLLVRAWIAICVNIKILMLIYWDYFFFRSETVIINRKIFPKYCPFFVRSRLSKYLKKRKVIWDFDDNIIYCGEISKAELLIYQKAVDQVVVTNTYLKDTLSDRLKGCTSILTTTDRAFERIDLDEWNSNRKEVFQTHINLIWVGTKYNLVYLENIIGQLDEVAKRNSGKTVTLYVVCNGKLSAANVTKLRIQNIPWTRQDAFAYMKQAHVGLMPLADNEFTRGKGAFKAVQCLGAGVPVVASPVGYNTYAVENAVNGYLTECDWTQCIQSLIESPEKWEEYSIQARRSWEERFNSKVNREFWYKIASCDSRE